MKATIVSHFRSLNILLYRPIKSEARKTVKNPIDSLDSAASVMNRKSRNEGHTLSSHVSSPVQT
jgi:phosphatidylserine decarboxylase